MPVDMYFGDVDFYGAALEGPTPTLEVSDPEVVDVLYGPDGEVLRVAYDRPPIKFGFR